MSRPLDSGFVGLPHVSNQARHDIDDKVDGAAMAGMLDLPLLLEWVVDGFDDEAFPQQQFVAHEHQAIFHVGFDAGDELETLFQQGGKERLGKIALIPKQLAKSGFRQLGEGLTIIDIARSEGESQDFTGWVNHEMEFEAVKPIPVSIDHAPPSRQTLCGA